MTAHEMKEWLVAHGWAATVEHEALVVARTFDRRREYRRETGLFGEPYWYVDSTKKVKADAEA